MSKRSMCVAGRVRKAMPVRRHERYRLHNWLMQYEEKLVGYVKEIELEDNPKIEILFRFLSAVAEDIRTTEKDFAITKDFKGNLCACSSVSSDDYREPTKEEITLYYALWFMGVVQDEDDYGIEKGEKFSIERLVEIPEIQEWYAAA